MTEPTELTDRDRTHRQEIANRLAARLCTCGPMTGPMLRTTPCGRHTIEAQNAVKELLEIFEEDGKLRPEIERRLAAEAKLRRIEDLCKDRAWDDEDVPVRALRSILSEGSGTESGGER